MKLSYGTTKYIKIVSWSLGILAIIYLYIRYPFYKFFPGIWWMQLVWWLGIFLLVWIFGIFASKGGKWLRGIKAEQDVEDVSCKLPKSFIPLTNIVPGGMGNIDQAIVGPTGIWVIEVKSHSGRITFDGRELRRDDELFEKDFLKQVWDQVNAVRDILKRELNKIFFVQPVICFSDVDAELHFGLKPVRGVYVIGLDWLNKLILKSPARLNDSAINEIVRILEKYKE